MNKMNKNSLGMGFLVLFAIIAFIALAYLGYKTMVVFGVWRIIITGLINYIALFKLQLLANSRFEKNGEIYYNPKEWPKYFNMFLSAGTTFYLYTHLKGNTVSDNDYLFGVSYLIIFCAIPTIFSTYYLIRDRNDYIKIGKGKIEYKDNNERGIFNLDDIINTTLSLEKGVVLNFRDGNSRNINISKMNFSARDGYNLMEDLSKFVSTTD